MEEEDKVFESNGEIAKKMEEPDETWGRGESRGDLRERNWDLGRRLGKPY